MDFAMFFSLDECETLKNILSRFLFCYGYHKWFYPLSDTNLRLNVVCRRDDFPSLALKLLDWPASGLRLSFECTWRIRRTRETAVPAARSPDGRFRNLK